MRAEDARIGQADARRNYRLAALAKAANGLPNDAATTFDACANAAGVSRQTLQEYATLTTRWSPEQIARMLSLTDRTGKALTRAHLLRFARGPLEVRAAFEAAVAYGQVRYRRASGDAAQSAGSVAVVGTAICCPKGSRNDVSTELCRTSGNLLGMGCQRARPPAK